MFRESKFEVKEAVTPTLMRLSGEFCKTFLLKTTQQTFISCSFHGVTQTSEDSCNTTLPQSAQSRLKVKKNHTLQGPVQLCHILSLTFYYLRLMEIGNLDLDMQWLDIDVGETFLHWTPLGRAGQE